MMRLPTLNWRIMDRVLGPALVGLIFMFIIWLGVLQPYMAREGTLRALETEWQGKETPIWTSTADMSAGQNALRHFEKHGIGMGYKTAGDYIAAAHTLLHDPAHDTVCGTQRDGDTVCYNKRLNRLAVMNKTGAPRTFFVPDPAIHQKASNDAYFCDQVSAPCPLNEAQ
ncbi:MAG: hypothetical protein V4621_06545 [Pseudomonadota bacterium]